MGWLEKLHTSGKELSRVGLIPAYDNFMHWGNKNDDEAGLPKIWKINGEKNIPYLDSIKDRVASVHTIPKYEHKALALCGMGDSLRKYVKYLCKLSDRYVILSTNSSCEYLLNNGITPHYVILLDGRPGNWTLDLGDKASDITAIFGPCAEPEAIKSWPGKIMIVPVGVKDKSLNAKIRSRWGKPLPTGGNALNSGFSIFSLLTEIKIVLLIGNDLSFKTTYYGDGRRSNNDNSGYFFSTDIHGEQVKTLIPLYEYKVWLETVMAQTWPEYHYINCSEGILGVDIDGAVMPFCEQLPLPLAIKRIDEAFKVEDSPLDYKLKYLYDQFYDHDLGNQQRGRGLWKHVIENHKFTKGLDVGCGRANGVQYAREHGYDVWGTDISSAAVKCWKERKVEKFCKVASADKLPFKTNSFDFVLCSEVMEHIPEENTVPTLKEILRVGSDKFLFTIALTPEKIPVANIVQSHINLHNPNWWVAKFEEAGFVVAGGATNEAQESLSIMAVKNSQPYDEGSDKLFIEKNGIGTIPVIGEVKGVPEKDMLWL
jgi:SAM-dependent methyltransferase